MAGDIFTLEQIVDDSLGGKAHGLAQLRATGLRVPPAFVIRDARVGEPPPGLDEHREALGTEAVAVRSSAADEDGVDASFAGQYETVLGVSGGRELREAIDRCVESARSARAGDYRSAQAETAGSNAATDAATMNVVVQTMVDARVAGVVFTADPVSARRDLLVVDAVEGLGERLVSGEATPDHYVIDPAGAIVRRRLTGDDALLSDSEIDVIQREARTAEARVGRPLDLEWAIDRRGELFWLQARPITTLPADLAEFDTVLPRPDDVLTISNISEMMPGAVCPLTMSFTGWGIDYGVQHMQVTVGARDRIDPAWQVTASVSGHLLLNLTGNLVMSAGVLGSSAERTAQTICGRPVPELEDLPPQPLHRRVRNTVRLMRYCWTAPSVVDRFTRDVDEFEIAELPDAVAMCAELVGRAPFFERAMAVHIQSSALSGFLCAIVENMVSGTSNESTVDEQAEAVRLLAGATEVESAVMLDELDGVVEVVAEHPDADSGFAAAPVEEAIAWLTSTPVVSGVVERFLDRHGHRGYRELCVRDPAWIDDPTPLVQSMQAAVRSRGMVGAPTGSSAPAVDMSELSRGLRAVLPRAHSAIRRREHTKSRLVAVAHRFHRGFAHLGQLLVADGTLPDADLVHFFTLDELPAFVAEPDGHAVQRAFDRRAALDHQQRLSFPEISVGLPTPLKPEPIDAADGTLHGRPASRGVVEGTVRVAKTLDEAVALEPGEILVTPITDIGWTPYFSLIGGLVTDLGSSVSHGAVIAREYGLPCIVNARTATRVLRTGDRVRLDGDAGVVEILH